MKIHRIISILLIAFLSVSAGPASRKDFSKARLNNVCKELRDDVLLYFVFIDTRTTYPWTEYDIMSTIDSIHVAKAWLEKQADKNGIPLNIKTDYYIGNEYTTINKNLPKKTVLESIEEPNFEKGISALNNWGDQVSKIVGESLYIKDKDGIPETSPPRTKERLIAHLRDEYRVESIALMFFVNNYFREDISIAINTMNTDDIEYAIISYKYPAEISHYFIKLFGGVDLYKSRERKSNRNVKLAHDKFPNDIMQNPDKKNIGDFTFGEFTQYMIGWKPELSPEYKPLLSDKLF